VGPSIKVGNDVAGRRSEENKLGLSSDKVAGGKGWHSREMIPKEFEGEEGHIALGVEGH
jgi:hypothetical protein